MKALGRGLMVALAIAALLAGCRGRQSPYAGGAGGAQQVIRVAQATVPTTLDPAQVEDGPTIELMMQVFEGLVQWSPDNELVPALATDWTISADGRTYTFAIRRGVKFHNGRELTADDFVFSINRCLNPRLNSPVSRTYMGDLVGATDVIERRATTCAGVEAPDPYTLKLTIDPPKAYFLAKLTYPTWYAVCQDVIDGPDGVIADASGFVGTGPFKLEEYRTQESIRLAANAAYWDGAPELTGMERRIILEPSTRHAMFETGGLDIVDVSMADYRADQADPDLAPLLQSFERPSVYYLALNQGGFAPFRDRRVRQAFAHAINKQEALDTVFLGLPRRAEGIIPPGVPGHEPEFAGLAYDPAKARQLLAAAGYPNGRNFPPLDIRVRAASPDLRRTCEVVVEDLKQNLNIDVPIRELEWGVFLQQRNQGVMPFYFLRWAADYLDPQNFLSLMLHSQAQENTLGYHNAEFDRLCDQADVLQDHQERLRLYQRAQRLAVDDAVWVPLYYQKDIELWSPRLRGVDDSAMGHLPHKHTYFAPE